MPALAAVTFDFWSTLIDGTPTPARTAQRMARLHAAIVGAGAACSADELQRAFERVTQHMDRPDRETFEEAGPPGRWAAVARELNLPEELIPFQVVEQAYTDLTLNPLPEPMPYARQAVAAIKQAGYRSGVVCNTGMAGGSVLREVLRRHGLYDYFDATVFSNEFGLGKPSPRIFEHALEALGNVDPARALHVGDIEWLDVRGARAAGMFAALYAPNSNGVLSTQADLVVHDWREFAAQVGELTTRTAQKYSTL